MVELTDSQLLAYLAGDVSPEIASQIEQSDIYKQRLRRLVEVEAKLRARMYRAECPSAQDLGDFHLGLSDSRQVSRIRNHLETCPYCTVELERLDTYLGSQPGLLSRARVILARLVSGLDEFQSQLMPAPELAWELRGREKAPFIFRAEEFQIVLESNREKMKPGKFTLTGLLVGPGNISGEVDLVAGERFAASTVIDDLGNFSFEHIESGNYHIVVASNELEILTPPFMV